MRKRNILRGYGSFSDVLSSGRSISSPPLRLFFRVISGSPVEPRVGFAVSGSVRLSSRRNRAKRLMREAFRQNRGLWVGVTPPIEAVWMYAGREDQVSAYSLIERAVQNLMRALRKELR